MCGRINNTMIIDGKICSQRTYAGVTWLMWNTDNRRVFEHPNLKNKPNTREMACRKEKTVFTKLAINSVHTTAKKKKKLELKPTQLKINLLKVKIQNGKYFTLRGICTKNRKLAKHSYKCSSKRIISYE